MRRGLRFLLRMLILMLTVILALLLLFRSRFYPAISSLARTQVCNVTSDLINEAVMRQIEAGVIQYDRIVYFEKDLNGRITALKTNMSEINRLKTQTLNLLNERILELDASRLGIPLGSLILPEFFSGKGPEIPIQVLAVRNSEAEFQSRFSEAGINQTLHQLTMTVSVDVTILALARTDSFTVTSEVVTAETIIVGDVPTTFFNTGG